MHNTAWPAIGMEQHWAFLLPQDALKSSILFTDLGGEQSRAIQKIYQNIHTLLIMSSNKKKRMKLKIFLHARSDKIQCLKIYFSLIFLSKKLFLFEIKTLN